MREKLPIPDERIMECLTKDYGIEVARFTFLPLGADANASVYKAESQDKAYFVKLKRGHHHDISVDVAQLLHKAGIQEIIPPIKTLHGRPTHRIDDFTLIVYPFIEGKDGFNRKLTDEQWIKLGKALRQVHEVNVPSFIQHEVRKETFSPKWREAVRALYTHIDSGLIGDEWTMKLIQFMEKHREEINQIVDRAEQLAQKIQDPKFVLCHSDIHGGNVLMDGNTIYIVDWDEPIMAPKERDLMFIGGGVGNVWNDPREEELFYQGYGKTEVNRTILAYYRFERIVEDIALYGHDLLMTTDRSEDRPQIFQFFTGMFEPRDVVEIAFRTEV